MIFTERTISVQKGTSSINDTIVLYRGDKNVEVRFTLNEGSPFKFGSGTSPNIIEKTEASYGQLVINTPNDLPSIFSEIVPTNEGKIVFTITTEMIDEITEVGHYTFQIRLFDENMNSRATLPEVANGIEIREPIATEDVTTTNEVGVATVGYAMTTAGTTEDAFDSQGNYNKTTWETGNRITAAKLNKIEAGIDGVNKKVASGGTGGEVDLSGYVTKETGNANQITFSDGQTFQAKLDSGTLKGEKGEQGEKGEKGEPGDGGNVTDEQIKTAVDDYLQKNPISGDISSITEDIPPTNLFDKNNLLTSRPNDSGGTTAGNFSNWIPVKAGRTYRVNNDNAKIWYFYDTNKTYYSWGASSTTYTIERDGYVLLLISDNVDVNSLKVIQGTNPEDAHNGYTKIKPSKIAPLSRWSGKRWLAIGDSITTEKNGYADKSYASMVATNLGMNITNIAVGGKALVDAITWVENLPVTDYDLVTIMMGTNDHAYQGTISNITNYFEQLVRKIQQRMPNAVIAYITPIKRVFFDNEGNESNVGADGYIVNHGTSLSELVDAMKIKCRELSIPCLDIYDVLDPKLEYVRKTYFIREDGKDGTHPNALGHAKFIAPRVNAFLESIAPFYMYINQDTSGEPSEPSEPSEPGVTTYTITKNLTNCTISNSASSIAQNVSYSATISANSGYTLSTVTVTMGGTNITSTAYSNGNISISSVTGNIVITANATQQSSGESDAVLLHSWNLAGQTTTDSNEKTIYADLTNNFNMIVQSGESIGNDRYYSGGGGLLLEKTDSFTLILNDVQGKTVYPKQLLHTGISSGVNIWGQSEVTPVTKGRFKLTKGADYGNYDLVGIYYTVDKESATTSMSFDKTVTIDTGSNYSIKITYDATNTVGKIYVNDELVCTINDSLLIDGIYLNGESEHIGYGEIKLYRGLI